MKHQSISFLSALLININIILGTGLFINSGILVEKAGIYGAFSYLFVGIVLLPLVLAISVLLKKYPNDGFYGFGNQTMGPLFGFMAGWIYFFAKQNSAVVAIYVFGSMIQEIFFKSIIINNALLTFLLIVLFSYLNMQNMKTGLLFQNSLMIGKAIVTFGIIISGLLFFKSLNLTVTPLVIGDCFSTVPLVLFSLLGFESICSVSMHAQNSKSLWKTIIGSYITIIIIYCTYQTIVFGFLNGTIHTMISFQETFAHIAEKISIHSGLSSQLLTQLFYTCIAFSALSGGYGILYANQWNLYILAHAKSFWGHSLFVIKNNAQMPFYTSIAQLLICTSYLIISQQKLYILQQSSAFGCTLTYGLGCLFLLHSSQNFFEKSISILGLCSALFLLIACINNFLINGFSSFIIFNGIIIMGIGLFYYQKQYEPDQRSCH